MEEEDPRSSLELIESSLEIFDAVKQRLGGSYWEFRSEAKHMLEELFRKHEERITNQVSFLLQRRVQVEPMIKSEVSQWFIILRRRMTPSAKANNPWFIKFERGLVKEIFDSIREIVHSSPSHFGLQSTGSTNITFINKNRLVRDLKKLTNIKKDEIKTILAKDFKGTRLGCKADIVVTDKKPFVISYDTRKMQVKVWCHYGYWNELGYSFHE